MAPKSGMSGKFDCATADYETGLCDIWTNGCIENHCAQCCFSCNMPFVTFLNNAEQVLGKSEADCCKTGAKVYGVMIGFMILFGIIGAAIGDPGLANLGMVLAGVIIAAVLAPLRGKMQEKFGYKAAGCCMNCLCLFFCKECSAGQDVLEMKKFQEKNATKFNIPVAAPVFPTDTAPAAGVAVVNVVAVAPAK